MTSSSYFCLGDYGGKSGETISQQENPVFSMVFRLSKLAEGKRERVLRSYTREKNIFYINLADPKYNFNFLEKTYMVCGFFPFFPRFDL